MKNRDRGSAQVIVSDIQFGESDGRNRFSWSKLDLFNAACYFHV